MTIFTRRGGNWEPEGSFLSQRTYEELKREEELKRQEEEAKFNNQLNEDLKHLAAEWQLADKIAGAITSNELANNSEKVYDTDQVVGMIKQKYYPPATDHEINSVLSALERDPSKVVKHVNNYLPDRSITLWQSRSSYNKSHGMRDDNDDKGYLEDLYRRGL
jgi:hypothetical protein